MASLVWRRKEGSAPDHIQLKRSSGSAIEKKMKKMKMLSQLSGVSREVLRQATGVLKSVVVVAALRSFEVLRPSGGGIPDY